MDCLPLGNQLIGMAPEGATVLGTGLGHNVKVGGVYGDRFLGHRIKADSLKYSPLQIHS